MISANPKVIHNKLLFNKSNPFSKKKCKILGLVGKSNYIKTWGKNWLGPNFGEDLMLLRISKKYVEQLERAQRTGMGNTHLRKH